LLSPIVVPDEASFQNAQSLLALSTARARARSRRGLLFFRRSAKFVFRAADALAEENLHPITRRVYRADYNSRLQFSPFITTDELTEMETHRSSSAGNRQFIDARLDRPSARAHSKGLL